MTPPAAVAREKELARRKETLLERLDEIVRGVEAGTVVGLALVTIAPDGGLGPRWVVSSASGPHAGTILRGAVAYLGAVLDAGALARSGGDLGEVDADA